MHLATFLLSSTLLALATAAPQRFSLGRGDRGRAQNLPQRNSGNNNPNTRFFTGNQALDSAAWGAAAGAATQFFSSQILRPCNTRTRGTTNNRVLGNDAVGNGLLGFLGGFAAATVAENSGLTNPCG